MVGFWSYWGKVVAQAWRETIKDSPVSSSLRFLASLSPTIAAFLAWTVLPNSTSPIVPILSLSLTFGLIMLWAILKIASIPPRLEAQTIDRLAQARADERPIAGSISNAATSPDWPIRDLFFHIDPEVLESTNEGDNWIAVEEQFLDAASLGRIQVWGRPVDTPRLLQTSNPPLEPIEAEYWRDVTLAHNFYQAGSQSTDTQTYPRSKSNPVRKMSDLRVSRAQALTVWAGPDSEIKTQFECRLSVLGVVSVNEQSCLNVEKVVVHPDDRHMVDVYFIRAATFEYVVSIEGNDYVFKMVRDVTPKSVRLRLQGPSLEVFPAIVKFTPSHTRFSRS